MDTTTKQQADILDAANACYILAARYESRARASRERGDSISAQGFAALADKYKRTGTAMHVLLEEIQNEYGI